MGRIRTIKPEFFKHSGLFDAEQESGLPLRIAFAGLWTCCDREGIFKWRPRELKLDALPYDNCDFSRVLDALATRGFILKYACGTDIYGSIPGWKRHQFINNKEPQSTFPQPPNNQLLDALPTRELIPDDALPTRGVKEGEGNGKGIEQIPSPKPRKRVSEPKHSKDPRHIACKAEIFEYYRAHNEGEDPDWEGREGKALAMFLSANPKLTADGIKKLLKHRSDSMLNHSDRPALWIPKLTSFRMGPLDAFNKPLGTTTNGHSKITARQQIWDEFMAKEI